MKVLVSIKQVIDYHVRVRLQQDGHDVEKNNVKMSINPFDEIALEQAIQLKEKNQAKEIIVMCVGTRRCQDALYTALAMGADRAILIETQQQHTPLQIAYCFRQIVLREQPQLVLMGKQAIDNDCNQTGQMLAGLLQWAQGTFISKLTLQEDRVEVVREVDSGLETLSLTLPAVITADLRLNKPRYITLPNIMKAKQKPLEKLAYDELSVAKVSRLQVKQLREPPVRSAGIRVASVRELLEKLSTEAGVL